MTQREFFFLKLMEEAAEVQHRISKLLQFGNDEIGPSQDETNEERLQGEIIDLLAILKMLEDRGFLFPVVAEFQEQAIILKERKVLDFMAHSITLGTVDPA